MNMDKDNKRILSVDIARFYAIALVFYGHFIERMMLLKNPDAAVQYKFIYSFHMLLFFIIAGYVAKESDIEFGVGKFLKHRVVSRLLPFLFFTAIFMIVPIFFPGDFAQLKLPSVRGYWRADFNRFWNPFILRAVMVCSYYFYHRTGALLCLSIF
jgi:acyltransferase